MHPWLHTLSDLSDAGTPNILVTVADTRGSAPRAAGTHMIVTRVGFSGSVGGGQLEARAIEIAHALLQDGAVGTRIVRFPLGASVGQCCGGVVQLSFEAISPDDNAWITEACAIDQSGTAWGRLRNVDDASVAVRIVTPTDCASVPDPILAEKACMLLESGTDCALISCAPQNERERWLIDVSCPPELNVMVFGAGHVGRAMIETFGRLPMRVTWVDTRDDSFPASCPDNVVTHSTDTPEAEVAQAPADTIFLVLTHSHALDFELTRAILDRGDFRFFGLIGSESKRRNFEARLRARGYTDGLTDRMNCPIGIPGLHGKEPAVIAVAVAAELLQLRGVSVSARSAMSVGTNAQVDRTTRSHGANVA